jgi:hypothetical protein
MRLTITSLEEDNVYYKHPAVAIGILAGVLVASQGCQSSPPPVFPNIGGPHLSEGAVIQGDNKTAQAILSVFKKGEDAVHSKDLDALMDLYSENYKHGGYTKGSVREVWKDLFDHNHDFVGSHIFSKITIETVKTVPYSHVTCTGSLWAVSNETGQRVNLDSWYGDVHNLIYEGGTWRLAGMYFEIPRSKESGPGSLPHPFF